MIERTLCVIKPDGMKRALVGTILARFERVGLKLVAMKMVQPDDSLANKHYQATDEWLLDVGSKTKESYAAKGKPLDKSEREIGLWVRDKLVSMLKSAPLVAFVLEGENAVKTVRKLVGATAPEHSAPGTVRGDFSHETYELADAREMAVRNLIHASGSVVEAEREIGAWFSKDELFECKRIDEELFR